MAMRSVSSSKRLVRPLSFPEKMSLKVNDLTKAFAYDLRFTNSGLPQSIVIFQEMVQIGTSMLFSDLKKKGDL
jgi:hypothetical protein